MYKCLITWKSGKTREVETEADKDAYLTSLFGSTRIPDDVTVQDLPLAPVVMATETVENNSEIAETSVEAGSELAVETEIVEPPRTEVLVKED